MVSLHTCVILDKMRCMAKGYNTEELILMKKVYQFLEETFFGENFILLIVI